jgi:eukaryotic-like serine/threonine-protein kinase
VSDLRAELEAGLTGQYVLVRALGRGGMATVFLATDLKHDRPVAFKVLHPDLAQSLGAKRFQREIRLAARLQHPHILTVHDSGATAGHLWFTMPFVEGESLRDRLRRERQLSLDDALRITRQAAQALHYAHEHGVVHRDIKPENLLLTSDGNTLVADFGIARALGVGGDDDSLTQTGMSVGTPAYMSPEQATGDRALDARSDIYSLASVLYEMLAGEQPYTGPTIQAILMKRLSEPVPRVRSGRPSVPEAVDAVIGKALAVVPADRYGTAAQFAQALEQAATTTSGSTHAAAPPATTQGAIAQAGAAQAGMAQATTVPASSPIVPGATAPAPAAPTAPAPHPARRRLALALAAAVVLAAAAVGVWMFRPKPVAAPSANHLAVLPFAVHGGGRLDFLAQGMVDLLSRNLDGAGDIRSVNGATVLAAAHADGGVADLEEGRRLARRLGAGLYVLGSVSAIGNQVRIEASLYDGAPPQPAMVSQASVSGDTTKLFELVDRLAADLMVRQGKGVGAHLLQTAATTTQSLPALKAYLDAEGQLRRGQFDSSLAGFQQAVQLDSTFALAYYRLAVAAAWSSRLGLIRPNTERAVHLADRLSERDRRLLQSFAALADGKPDDAESGYRGILQDYPDDLEAQWQLATTLNVYNPLRGRPIAEAAPVFEGVVKLDPEFLCPI